MTAGNPMSILIGTLQCIAAGVAGGVLVAILLCLVVLLLSGGTGAADGTSATGAACLPRSQLDVTINRGSQQCDTPTNKVFRTANNDPPPQRLVAGRTMCLQPLQGTSRTLPPEAARALTPPRDKEVKS